MDSLDDPKIHEATEDDELLERVVSFYHRTLLADEVARGWLERTGLGSDELLRHFEVGLANRTLGPTLPMKKVRAGAEIRARLRALGVMRESGHEHLNGCIVVPIRGPHGEVVQLYGRRIAATADKRDEQDLWLHADRRGVLPVGTSSEAAVVLTTSVLDALAVWSFGHRHVTAMHGADGPTEDVVAELQRCGASSVVAVAPAVELSRSAAALRGASVKVDEVAVPAGFSSLREYVGVVPEPEARLVEMLGRASGRAASRVPKHPVRKTRRKRRARKPKTSAPPTPVSVPKPPPATSSSDPTGDEIVLLYDDRRWRIRGLTSNGARGTLRVNILVTREGAGLHMDVLDVCAARQRETFVRAAAVELCVDELLVRRDMARTLLALEKAQDEHLSRAEAPKALVPEMSEARRDAALALLRDPSLLDRIADDLGRVGIVGERDNLLLTYLVATSRILPQPLAVAVVSSAAAGKSSLVQAVLSLVPEEAQVVYSAMTGQSLYYMGAVDLRHKVLSVAEELGASRATYALKILQSEGRLTLATTGKESATGRLVSQTYTVQGPVAIMMTTTSLDLDEELQSRCLVLTADEGPEQTRRIQAHQLQARTLGGLRRRDDRPRLVQLHRDAQRLLRPLAVVVPDALDLKSEDLRVRARRDFRKLLGLVETIALLHQHQRKVHSLDLGDGSVEAIYVEPRDVEIARRLLDPILPGPHELAPHTRRVLEMLDGYVTSRSRSLQVHRDHIRFSQRELRERLGLGRTQLAMHLRRLVDVELVRRCRAPEGRQRYALCFQGTSPKEDPGSSGGRPGGIRPGSGLPSGQQTQAISDGCGAATLNARGIGRGRAPRRTDVHVPTDGGAR